ncbi:MAG: MarR family transcriptional regulator [Actinomycetia bacterium]|nr:MarR family transcriptional regulator [Actinomycetes bacterium]
MGLKRGGQAPVRGIVAGATGIKSQPFLGELTRATISALEGAEVPLPKPGHRRVGDIGPRTGAGIATASAKAGRAEAPPGNATRRDAVVVPMENFFLNAAILLNVIRNLDGERDNLPIGFLGAGLPQTKGLLTRAAAFGERTTEMVLGGLDDRAARAVLTEPAARLGVTWTPGALQRATDRANGHPQSLHIIGAATWGFAEPSPGGVLTEDDLLRGETDIATELTSMFDARWSAATPAERAVLAAMASLGEAPTKRADLAERLGVTTYALSRARASLIGKGIIEVSGHGCLRFTAPGFGEYARAAADATDPAPPHSDSAENPTPPRRA